ncbi:hypothetical protein BASA50_000635 [Batrachochytrium salamandrivorans]|uniref:Uncharacterized protein n=1 Tax=Batrachochytrium salamandrivorans TaxID=1357716 RepID=A0ABQ8EU77_9FUNG|nr:hypothetical protein BASA50_000635 [Batrachochytrium salamandrivorans]KAH9245745.1 hypothetical protein BASA81_016761 [Batrachochytrium salamandrivorans]
MQTLPDRAALCVLHHIAQSAPKTLWVLYHTCSTLRRLLLPIPVRNSSNNTRLLLSGHSSTLFVGETECDMSSHNDSTNNISTTITTTHSHRPDLRANRNHSSREIWALAFHSLLATVSLTFPPPDFLKLLARRHFHLVHFAVHAGTSLGPQDLAFALLVAIAAPCPPLCRRLIDAGAALALDDSWHPDPLHYAAEMGCNSVCTMLVRSDAAKGRSGKSDCSAMTDGCYNTAPLLIRTNSIGTIESESIGCRSVSTINANSNIISKTDTNCSYINRSHKRYGRPLDRAVYARQFSTCQLLLKLGAAKRDDPGLIDAICYNDQDLCDWLLAKGANPNLSDRTGGDSPLYIAALVGNDTICQHLVAAGALLVSTPSPPSPAAAAAVTCTITPTTSISSTTSIGSTGQDPVSNLAPPSPPSSPPAPLVPTNPILLSTMQPQSPLFAAITGGHLRAFKSLLAMAKTYGVLRHLAPSLFLEVCRCGQPEMLQQLYSAGTFKGIDKQALLYVAIDAGHASVCQVLVDDIDFQIKDLEELSSDGQQTLLHRAAWARSGPCCEVLVAAGADINGLNKGLDTPLHIAIESGSLELCTTLIRLGANVNAANRSGETPLHYAAMHALPAICVLLADSGAHLYSQSNDGQNPLHLAVETGSYDTCFSLVYDIGADVNATNRAGETPLHRAAMFAYYDVCELLIMCGALINAISHVGATPLDFAMADLDSRLALYLKSHGALVSSKLGEIVYTFRLRMKLES